MYIDQLNAALYTHGKSELLNREFKNLLMRKIGFLFIACQLKTISVLGNVHKGHQLFG